MKMTQIALVLPLLLAACAPCAYGGFIPAAISIFDGSVTQAPGGNIFSVGIGSPVHGEVFWPPNPIHRG